MYEYPLTTEQLFFYDLQKKYPSYPICNGYAFLVKLHDWVDMKKMSESLVKTAQAHPACLSLVEETGGGGTPLQKYVPDLITDVKIEKLSEYEFQSIINNLVQPFNSLVEAPFKLKLFETEIGKYFFFDANHIFDDGYSVFNFLDDLSKIYFNEEVEPDNWFSYLEEHERSKKTPHYLESKKYYEDIYGGTEWSFCPKPDYEIDEDKLKLEEAIFFRDSEFSENDLEILKEYNLTYNEFFSIISLLSISTFNNAENVFNTWIYKGRWKKSHVNIVGNMIMEMPFALKLKGMSLNQIFKSIKEQLKGNLLHRDYPYIMLDEKISDEYILCSFYQADVYEIIKTHKLFEKLVADFHSSANIFDFSIKNNGDKFSFIIEYLPCLYKSETAEKFADIFAETAQKLLKAMRDNKCDSEVWFQ